MNYIKLKLIEIEDYTSVSDGLYRLNFLVHGNDVDVEGSGNVGFCVVGTVETTVDVDGVTAIDSVNTNFGKLLQIGNDYGLDLVHETGQETRRVIT